MLEQAVKYSRKSAQLDPTPRGHHAHGIMCKYYDRLSEEGKTAFITANEIFVC